MAGEPVFVPIDPFPALLARRFGISHWQFSLYMPGDAAPFMGPPPDNPGVPISSILTPIAWRRFWRAMLVHDTSLDTAGNENYPGSTPNHPPTYFARWTFYITFGVGMRGPHRKKRQDRRERERVFTTSPISWALLTDPLRLAQYIEHELSEASRDLDHLYTDQVDIQGINPDVLGPAAAPPPPPAPPASPPSSETESSSESDTERRARSSRLAREKQRRRALQAELDSLRQAQQQASVDAAQRLVADLQSLPLARRTLAEELIVARDLGDAVREADVLRQMAALASDSLAMPEAAAVAAEPLDEADLMAGYPQPVDELAPIVELEIPEYDLAQAHSPLQPAPGMRFELEPDEQKPAEPDASRDIGHYDQSLIEQARSFQTRAWYKEHADRIWRIKNRHDNRCLFYAIAIANKLSDYRNAKAETRRLRALRRPVPKDVEKAQSSKTLAKIRKYASDFSEDSKLTYDATTMALRIVGHDDPDIPFTFDDIVRAHNYVRALFVVLTCEDATGPWKEVFRSDAEENKRLEEPPVALDAEQRPVVFLFWTPEPANHLDLIPDIDAAALCLGLRKARLCRVCLHSYSDMAKHRCARCSDCMTFGCSARKLTVGWGYREVVCASCNMRFKNQASYTIDYVLIVRAMVQDCFERHTRAGPSTGSYLPGQSLSDAVGEHEVALEDVPRMRKRSRKSICERRFYCPNPRCRNKFERRIRDRTGQFHDHICGHEVCGHCGRYEDRAHDCYITSGTPKKSGSYVFLDTECHCVGTHRPYLIRVHDGLQANDYSELRSEGGLGGFSADGAWIGERLGDFDSAGNRVKHFFEGDDCVGKFVRWAECKVYDTKKGFTVIAHNGSGYDWPVMYKQLVLYEGGRLRVRPTYRGTALISMTMGIPGRQIRFVDSLLFVQTRLADLPAMFAISEQMQAAGFSMDKEFFPHWLTWLDEFGDERDPTLYEGDFPPTQAFRPDEMHDPKRRELFYHWYTLESAKYEPQQPGRPWRFMQQAMEYCDCDVEILRRAMCVFRTQFMRLTAPEYEYVFEPESYKGMDPFTHATLPSACMAAYRYSFMPPDSIANLPIAVDTVMRQALRGGRTQACTFYEFDTRLHYYDFNSLYPFVMVARPYPRGYPKYFGTDLEWPARFVDLEGPARLADLQTYVREGTLAILCVDVTCPSTLLHPVLGTAEKKEDGTTKFCFTLNPKKRLWTNSPELREALRQGYKVTAVHAVAWWDEKHVAPAATDDSERSLFGAYFKRFVPVKDAASGFPDGCISEEQKTQFLTDYATWTPNQGVALSRDEIKKNAPRKACTKFAMNNLWGKFTQRTAMAQTRIFHGHQAAEFHELQFSSEYLVDKVIVIRTDDEAAEVGEASGVIEVVFRRVHADEIQIGRSLTLPPGRTVSREVSAHAPHLGVFVTAYARLELYRVLDIAGEDAVYCDTDSIVLHERAVPAIQHLVGPLLGQLKDELHGTHITHWASGGPKNYAYRTSDGSEKSVLKGVRRAALLPDFQMRFIRAAVIATGLRDEQSLPTPQLMLFSRLQRDRAMHQVRTEALAYRQFRLVNNKVQLFPDGTSLPIGHAGIEAKEELCSLQRDHWRDELEAALRDCLVARVAQNERDGDGHARALTLRQSKTSQRRSRNRHLMPPGQDTLDRWQARLHVERARDQRRVEREEYDPDINIDEMNDQFE